MKLNAADKFFIAIIMLLLLALAFVCIAVPFGLFDQAAVNNFVQLVFAGGWQGICVGAAGVVIFILLIRVLIGLCRKPSDAQQPVTPATAALVKQCEFGAMHISIAALDTMVQRQCRLNNKIRECTSSVVPGGDGISIKLKVALLNDANLPETSKEIQSSLKSYIEGLTGVTVSDVDVLVVPPTAAK